MSSSSGGAPVSVVVISVANLEASLGFYAETIGLTNYASQELSGPEFEAYWRLPAGSSARCAFLGHGADPVGRIQLMEFAVPGVSGQQVRETNIKRATGLFNINLYTDDIKRDYAQLSEQGFSFWSDEPAYNNFGPAVGETYELAFDGPDGVVINLVELLTDDPKTMIGHLWHYMADYGRTATGFTSVVTTAHSVVDMEKALAFYYGPLGMTLFVDSVLEGEETNRALNLAPNSRTHSVLVQGDHEFGKIALAAPMNYQVPDLVPDSEPPNFGYLAQSFQVSDLDSTAEASAAVNAIVYSPQVEIDLPGRGRCRAMIVRNPGSGALQEIFQPLG